MKTKHELLREGVTKVKDMGFRMVDTENIYYDEVYSAYFHNMLIQKKGTSRYLDEVIDEIIKEIEFKSNPT
ncbi:MAG: hypothetical protein H7282_01545 [Cytophagaceae bacterium]|nr:hypothetical protein [Cytophagaceae bacterium]